MREAGLTRKTNEVNIEVNLNIDGEGRSQIDTTCYALDHLLTLFSFWGLFDLKILAEGDTTHHLIEDLGISLGKAFKEALKSKEGINRFGCFTAVMDKVCVEVALDISGRASLKEIIYSEEERKKDLNKETFDDTTFTFSEAKTFLESFTQQAGISLVYIVKSSEGDLHHILEALFKALGKALDIATTIDPRRKGVPSTKGIID